LFEAKVVGKGGEIVQFHFRVLYCYEKSCILPFGMGSAKVNPKQTRSRQAQIINTVEISIEET